MTITYRDDVTLTTRSCVLGTCSVINVSYSRSITRGIFRRSHLHIKKDRSAECVQFMISSTDMEAHAWQSVRGIGSLTLNVDQHVEVCSILAMELALAW